MSDTTPNISTLTGPSFAKDLQGSGLLKKRWLYHLLFWLAYYVLMLILYMSLHEKMTLSSCIFYFVVLCFQALFAYFNIYLLIPRLLFAKKYIYYAVALVFNIVMCSLIIMLLEALYRYVKAENSHMPIFTLGNLGITFIQETYLVGMVTGMKFVKDSILNQQWMKEKEKHYLETELKFLRSQIHPHFFFNTLNNIYSLTLKKSDQAPGIILKLSDLMSYMLYESNVPLVPLSKEIDYLQNYLDVEQLRFGQRLSVSFTRTGFIEDVNIPPMILILFLENSFKHGVKNNISKIHIEISLKIDTEFLYFKVDNPVTEDEAPAESKGIGLKNVRRRLDLLYGDGYTLDIRTVEAKFSVSLKMPLC
ncbi:MAG TPA: histidine kinase [Puia sp.]|jgi:LytS/YehU family sensor histidine kinase|nr:histidine kinase [Puia sp.]